VVSQYTTDSVKFILAPPLQYTRDNPFDKSGFPRFKGRSNTNIATSTSRRATRSVSAIV
jgi:hypothetical protein